MQSRRSSLNHEMKRRGGGNLLGEKSGAMPAATSEAYRENVGTAGG